MHKLSTFQAAYANTTMMNQCRVHLRICETTRCHQDGGTQNQENEMLLQQFCTFIRRRPNQLRKRERKTERERALLWSPFLITPRHCHLQQRAEARGSRGRCCWFGARARCRPRGTRGGTAGGGIWTRRFRTRPDTRGTRCFRLVCVGVGREGIVS